MSYQEIRRGHLKKWRIRENRIKQPFYTMQRSNPLGSTVSITNMLYCQGRTDNSWGPRAIGIMGPLCPCPNSKKPMKKVPGTSHGAPTDNRPSGSARVSKWSVHPCHVL
ncbi:unnamed protein product [Staurois parvus]|uniref:Uncharacterized protein n=1 Tax=Staurois parvus TaxID=386267 RepID=A0ABN9GBH5_9NEOB|nr:unnamed protein product [Staurois parvus]